MAYQTLTYSRDDRVATITLNRPERLNAISRRMPDEIRAAVEEANRDDLVHVIVLQGAGRASARVTTSGLRPNSRAAPPAARKCRGIRSSTSS